MNDHLFFVFYKYYSISGNNKNATQIKNEIYSRIANYKYRTDLLNFEITKIDFDPNGSISSCEVAPKNRYTLECFDKLKYVSNKLKEGVDNDGRAEDLSKV
jgi:hypothetical protein